MSILTITVGHLEDILKTNIAELEALSASLPSQVDTSDSTRSNPGLLFDSLDIVYHPSSAVDRRRGEILRRSIDLRIAGSQEIVNLIQSKGADIKAVSIPSNLLDGFFVDVWHDVSSSLSIEFGLIQILQENNRNSLYKATRCLADEDYGDTFNRHALLEFIRSWSFNPVDKIMERCQPRLEKHLNRVLQSEANRGPSFIQTVVESGESVEMMLLERFLEQSEFYELVGMSKESSESRLTLEFKTSGHVIEYRETFYEIQELRVKVIVRLKENFLEFLVDNYYPQEPGTYLAVHPHIGSSGEVCFGNYSTAARVATNQLDIAGSLVLLEKLLKSYNPTDPYHKINKYKYNVVARPQRQQETSSTVTIPV